MLQNVRAFRLKEFRSPWLLQGLLLPLLHRTSGEACAGGAANNMVRFGKFRVNFRPQISHGHQNSVTRNFYSSEL